MFDIKALLSGRPNPWHLFFALAVMAYMFAGRIDAFSTVPCGGMGDCVKYLRMSELFADGHSFPAPIEYPFNLRLGTPWLVSLFGVDHVRSYMWIGVASSVAFMVCFYMVARALGFVAVEFMLVALWFLLHPLGLASFFSVAATVDPLAQAFMGLAALLFLTKKRVAFWLALGIALLVKESFVFVALVAILAELACAVAARHQDRPAMLRAFASCLGGVCVIVLYKLAETFGLPHIFPKSQPYTITTAHIIGWWALQAVRDPNRILVWIAACFCATGFFSVWIAGKWPPAEKLADPLEIRRAAFLALGAAGFAAFGLVAGADMSRIVFTGNVFLIGFFLYMARARGLAFGQKIPVFLASLVLALAYGRFFPSHLEYAYYGSHDIGLTLKFVLACVGIWCGLWLFIRLSALRVRG